jgi:hypothetical protein
MGFIVAYLKLHNAMPSYYRCHLIKIIILTYQIGYLDTTVVGRQGRHFHVKQLIKV